MKTLVLLIIIAAGAANDNNIDTEAKIGTTDNELMMNGLQLQMAAISQKVVKIADAIIQNNDVKNQEKKEKTIYEKIPKNIRMMIRQVETDITVEYNSDTQLPKRQIRNHMTTCPDGFVALNGSCYHFSSSSVNDWITGSEKCSTLDSRSSLLNMESVEEWDVIRNYLKQHNLEKTNWFIGGSDQAEEDTWRWLQNNQSFSFSDWCQGQPDQAFGNQDCSMITAVNEWYNSKRRLCWDDIRCRVKETGLLVPTHFICEINKI